MPLLYLSVPAFEAIHIGVADVEGLPKLTGHPLKADRDSDSSLDGKDATYEPVSQRRKRGQLRGIAVSAETPSWSDAVRVEVRLADRRSLLSREFIGHEPPVRVFLVCLLQPCHGSHPPGLFVRVLYGS